MFVVLIPPGSYVPSTNNLGKIRIERNGSRILDLPLDWTFFNQVSGVTGNDGMAYSVAAVKSTNAWEIGRALSWSNKYEIVVENGPIGGSVWLYHMRPAGWDVPVIRKLF